MVDLAESDKMIKKKKMEKWINQTPKTSLVVIFRSLFKEKLLQTKNILSFFYYFIYFLSCKKTQKNSSLKKFFLE